MISLFPRHAPNSSKAKKHWSETWTFGAAVVILLLVVSGAAWWQDDQSAARLRSETSAQTQLRAAQVTSATSTAVSILFRAVDMTARELARGYAQFGGRGFDERARLAIERLPSGAILQVAVIGADGYLAYSNLGMAEKVFLGDREHFKVHLQSDHEQLFISKPVLGRVSKQWSIQFSRPIKRNSQTIGVVVLSVSPAYLQEALAAVTLNSEDAITVLRTSGEFLARNRDMAGTLGKSSDPDRPFLTQTAVRSGSFTARSLIDGIERVSHWQRLDDYPVVVVLGLSAKATFDPVDRAIENDNYTTGLGLLALWITGLGTAFLARRMNIQARRREEMEFLAMNDALTGLQSRHALMLELKQELLHASRAGTQVGLLYLDLDRFKPINDAYGHAAGDEVLKAVALRIKGCVRSPNVVARIGGDEFVVMLNPLPDAEALDHLRSRILEALDAPIALANVQVHVGACIGLAVYPRDGSSADALLSFADQKMYLEKTQKAVDRRPIPVGLPLGHPL